MPNLPCLQHRHSRAGGNDGVFGFSGCFEAVPASTPSEHKRGDDVSEKQVSVSLRRVCGSATHAVCGFGCRLNIPACATNNRPSENAVSVLPERFQTACCAVAYGSRVRSGINTRQAAENGETSGMNARPTGKRPSESVASAQPKTIFRRPFMLTRRVDLAPPFPPLPLLIGGSRPTLHQVFRRPFALILRAVRPSPCSAGWCWFWRAGGGFWGCRQRRGGRGRGRRGWRPAVC